MTSFNVSVENQGYIKKADVEFIPGLNVLRGKSSQGKSTLIRAIETTVFNIPSDYLITYGETKSSVSIGYNKHKIERIRDTQARENKTVYFIDGEKYVKNGRTALEDVQNAIGVKEIEVSKDKIHLAFSAAFGKPFLVDESPNKVFDFLTYSTSSNNLSLVVSKIKEDLATAKDDLKSTEASVDAWKKMVDSTEQRLRNYEGVEVVLEDADRIKKEASKFDSIEGLLRSAEETGRQIDKIKTLEGFDFSKNLDEEEKKNEQLQQIISSLDKLQSDIDNNEKELESLDKTIKAFPVVDIDEIKRQSECVSKLDKDVSSLLEIIRQGKILSGAVNCSLDISFLSGLYEQYSRVSALTDSLDIKTVKQRISENKQIEMEYNDILKEIEKIDVCPLCGNKISSSCLSK